MAQLIKVFMILLTVVVLAACGANSEKSLHTEDSTNHNQHENMPSEHAATGVVNLKDDKLNAVYQHYVHLTKALVNSDAAEAKVASNAIEAGAKEVPGAATIASAASKITLASDIDAQRAAYSTLSNEFITLTRESGLTSGKLYVDFCPMAMNDKGAYWLSSSKEIKNPYFGDKMLTCGEVKETIQ